MGRVCGGGGGALDGGPPRHKSNLRNMAMSPVPIFAISMSILRRCNVTCRI